MASVPRSIRQQALHVEDDANHLRGELADPDVQYAGSLDSVIAPDVGRQGGAGEVEHDAGGVGQDTVGNLHRPVNLNDQLRAARRRNQADCADFAVADRCDRTGRGKEQRACEERPGTTDHGVMSSRLRIDSVTWRCVP